MSELRIINRPSPYSSFLDNLGSFPVTDAFKTELRSFLRDVKREVDECQRSVDELKTALRTAEKDKAAAQAFYDAHDSLSPPIHDLPTELVIRILELSIDARPLLLTGSHIREPRRPELNMTILAAALKRSQNAPLSFDICDNQRRSVLKALVPHSSRWRRVTIGGYINWDIPDLGTLPVLETFRLELDAYSYGPKQKLGDRWIRFLELFKDAPRLREFALPCVEDGGRWLCPNNIDFPWRQLTRLKIGGWGDDVYSILAACPNLQRLDTIGHLDFGSKHSTDIPGVRPRLCHNNLMSLQVRHPNYLRDIECPNLGHLRIEGDQIVYDLQRSGTVECYRSFMSRSKYPSLRLEYRYRGRLHDEDEVQVMNFAGMIADTRLVALTLDIEIYSFSLEACTCLLTKCMAFPLLRTLTLIIGIYDHNNWLETILKVVVGKVKGSSLEHISLKVSLWRAKDYFTKWAQEVQHAYPYLWVESVSETFISLVVKPGLVNPGNVVEQMLPTSKDVQIQRATDGIGL
ncbi:hypothetical protein BDZ89DRAFT_1122038 [Hymenopellis radicata]|nr:hypothetical protein BDZ89DRAFT_1122038 [Hymenopellis radicata]